MTVLDFVRPSVCLTQPAHSSAGAEAVDLARMAGLVLDPWQAFVLEHSLAEKADGTHAAFEVGLNVARQNGKGTILEARELAGLFLLGERLIVHSAHQFDTSMEHFSRLLGLIEETPEFLARVRTVSKSHGAEGITLKNGQRIRFRTRTKGGGRGFTADLLVMDEAMFLPEAMYGALLPTLSARPNPQVWYAGSAVDQEVHPDGVVFARVRERGLAGEDDSLAYFEWSYDPRDEESGVSISPDQVSADQAADYDAWQKANPSLGIRISPTHVEHERRSMDPRTFAVERLGVGDWPSTDPGGPSVIDVDDWRALVDPRSAALDPVVFAFDVLPDRRASSICAAGIREDGLVHVEVVAHRQGTGWLAERLEQLRAEHAPLDVLCDGQGPAAALAEECGATVVSGPDYVKACGAFYDLVADGKLRHLGSREIDVAIRGAAKRPLVDAWAWSRKSSRADITPLVAMTLAGAHIAQSVSEPFVVWG